MTIKEITGAHAKFLNVIGQLDKTVNMIERDQLNQKWAVKVLRAFVKTFYDIEGEIRDEKNEE